MLSSFSKLADKNFIVGFFIPSLLSLIAITWTFPSILALEALHSVVATDDDLKKLIYVGLTIWLFAIVLMTANYWLYRLFEGYLPPTSWLSFRTKTHINRLKNIQNDAKAEKNDSRLLKLRLRLQIDYPPSENLVKPTRFGNRIQAFEAHSATIYGADAVGVWPRLVSVIPRSFMVTVEDARAQVNFYMNISFLAGLLLVVDTAAFVCHLAPLAPSLSTSVAFGPVLPEVVLFSEDYRLLGSAVFALIVCFLSYRSATSALLGWGELIRSAFDCYLPALIAQLGYENPCRPEDRKRFWTEFSQLVLYGDPIGLWPITKAAKTKEGGDAAEGSPGESEKEDNGDT